MATREEMADWSLTELLDRIEELKQDYGLLLVRNSVLSAKLDAALEIGEVHPSWGSTDDFNRGWHKCREQFRSALQEQKDE